MTLLRADEIAAIRACVETTFSTPCTIARLVSGVWTDQSTMQGDIAPAKGTITLPGLPSLTALQAWRITVPWDADVRVGDRITTTTTGTYGVQRVEQPTSDMLNFSSVCHALQLYDVAGGVLYVPLTATIGLTRYVENATTKQSTLTVVATDVEAFIDDISLEPRTPGVAPEFLLSLVVDGAVDIRDGDHVTGYTGWTVDRPATLQVQHVALHQYAGAVYKQAHITAVG